MECGLECFALVLGAERGPQRDFGGQTSREMQPKGVPGHLLLVQALAPEIANVAVPDGVVGR